MNVHLVRNVVRGQSRHMARVDEEEHETLSDRLVSAMQEAGLGQHGGLRELARRSGVLPGTISRVINYPERKPEADTIKRLADALGVHNDWLAHGTGPRLMNTTLTPDEQYPNRAKAIEAARLLRTASEEAIQTLQTTERMGAEGWTEQDWYDELLTEERRRRRGRVTGETDYVDEAPPGVPKRKGKR